MIKISKITSIVLAVFATIFLSLSPSVAQELTPEHIALARKYVDLTDRSEVYEITLVQAGINTMKTIMSTNPEVKDELDEAIGLTIKDYVGQKDALFNQFARVYAIEFSMEELQEIVDFYETDVGLKLAGRNAGISRNMQAVMGVFEANLRIEFFAKVRSRLREKGLSL